MAILNSYRKGQANYPEQVRPLQEAPLIVEKIGSDLHLKVGQNGDYGIILTGLEPDQLIQKINELRKK